MLKIYKCLQRGEGGDEGYIKGQGGEGYQILFKMYTKEWIVNFSQVSEEFYREELGQDCGLYCIVLQKENFQKIRFM